MPRPHKIWFRKDTGWWMVTIAGKKVRLAQGRQNRKQAEQEFHKLMLTSHQAPVNSAARVVDVVEAILAFSQKRSSPDTYRNYRFYGQSLAETCGLTPACDLRPFHVSERPPEPSRCGRGEPGAGAGVAANRLVSDGGWRAWREARGSRAGARLLRWLAHRKGGRERIPRSRWPVGLCPRATR
jgi:hypothetical protein